MNGRNVSDNNTTTTLADAAAAVREAHSALNLAANTTRAAAHALKPTTDAGNVSNDGAANAAVADAITTALAAAIRASSNDLGYGAAPRAGTAADILKAADAALNAVANGAYGTAVREARRALNAAERGDLNTVDRHALNYMRTTLNDAPLDMLDNCTPRG